MDVTSYLLGKKAGGGSKPPVLQDKEVTITENGTTTVSADAGYTGLGTVGVTTNVPTSGPDLSEYFTETISGGDMYAPGFSKGIKKFPSPLTVNGTSLDYAFYKYKGTEIPSVIGTQNVTSMKQCFGSCTNITTLDLTTWNTDGMLIFNYTFNNCTNLESLNMNGLDFGEVADCEGMFRLCYGLKNLTFGYDLGKNYSKGSGANNSNYTLDLSASELLTHDSLMSVINGLYDIASAGVQPQKLVLGATNLAKLTQDEKDIVTNKGWNLS